MTASQHGPISGLGLAQAPCLLGSTSGRIQKAHGNLLQQCGSATLRACILRPLRPRHCSCESPRKPTKLAGGRGVPPLGQHPVQPLRNSVVSHPHPAPLRPFPPKQATQLTRASRKAIYFRDRDYTFKTGLSEAGNLSCRLERCVKDTVKGDMRTWGQRLIQHCYNTFFNEQNIFKNPYKFFIICYTFRDNIYNKRTREGGERNLLYSKPLHKTRGPIDAAVGFTTAPGLPWKKWGRV